MGILERYFFLAYQIVFSNSVYMSLIACPTYEFCFHWKIFSYNFNISNIIERKKILKDEWIFKKWFHLHEKIWDCERQFILINLTLRRHSFCWDPVKCFLFYPLALCPFISWISATPSIFQIHSSFLKVDSDVTANWPWVGS